MEEQNTEETRKLKLQLITSDNLWDLVQRYKMDRNLKNNNDAVEELIKKGLPEATDKTIVYVDARPSENVVATIKEFKDKIPSVEKKEGTPLLILKDQKSGAHYSECHIFASEFVQLADPDAIIKIESDEDLELHRANRQLEPDNYYFIQMIEDAKGGRQFSDIVIEYNTEYAPNKPLKILGGQHRHEAIIKALKENINHIHGIRVYFNLTGEQQAEIMRISNTNINVSPDLRDRIEESALTPADMLRTFCQTTGILKAKQDFGDKKRTDDFAPTVRMMRSFIVNFIEGRDYQGNADDDAVIPSLCESGKHIDKDYLQIFNQFKSKKAFDDAQLIEAAKMFAKLHNAQFKNSENFKGIEKKEFKIKAFSLSIIASWAFAAGTLQKNPERLNKLYDLPALSGPDDPLNATAMGKAKHKTDTETYRGLGTRSGGKEVGRVLQLFLSYSQSKKPKITLDMCNAAIDIFHSNEARISAEKKRKEAF
ncbi:MAG: hypothetical protein ABIG69_18530 [Bacteroidota bacterium]|nr:hypothetical protein [Candidatus Micrarchaeota archaeon]MBU1165596.1 hypothetical protein [Candidatus Micrarchaeota archaeon]MBU1886204.1 hypothetical protein [Candidatus Micrarchaeota archaeon]